MVYTSAKTQSLLYYVEPFRNGDLVISCLETQLRVAI